MRKWKDTILVGDVPRWRTLRIQKIYGLPTDEELYSLDMCEQLVLQHDEQGVVNAVHLFCSGLVLRKAGDRVYKPVDASLAAQLGDLGVFRISRSNRSRAANGNDAGPPPATLGDRILQSWPRMGRVPVVPFALESIQFTEDLANCKSAVGVEGVTFSAVLPCPRDVAFPEPAEHPTSVRKAAQEARFVKCTVHADQNSSELGDVDGQGTFAWLLPVESPRALAAGSFDTSDGPHELHGNAGLARGRGVWTLTNVAGSLRLMGLLSGQTLQGLGDLTLAADGDHFCFATDSFDPAADESYGLSIGSNPRNLPQFRLKGSLPVQLAAQAQGRDARRLPRRHGCGPSPGPRAGEYERTLRLVIQSVSFELAGVHDIYYGFASKDGSPAALIVWVEDSAHLGLRQWSEEPPTPITATLSVAKAEGGPWPSTLEFEGVEQRINVKSSLPDSLQTYWMTRSWS